MSNWSGGDYIGSAFEVSETDDADRYCGPCGISRPSRMLLVRPRSNGSEDGSCYWQAEVWECKLCGHGGQTIHPLFVTKRSRANAALQ